MWLSSVTNIAQSSDLVRLVLDWCLGASFERSCLLLHLVRPLAVLSAYAR